MVLVRVYVWQQEGGGEGVVGLLETSSAADRALSRCSLPFFAPLSSHTTPPCHLCPQVVNAELKMGKGKIGV